MTDRGAAGGPEIAAAAVPPAGAGRERRRLGNAGSARARPRPRRMLSPCPDRPGAHDGDTGAQSVPSRGESCAALRRGHPSPRAPSRPRAAGARPGPSPAAVRVRAARERSPLVPPPAARFPGSARASRAGEGPGRARDPGDGTSRGGAWPPPLPLRPRRAFAFAFDNFLPAETLSYLAKAPSPLLPPGGSWFIHILKRKP